MSIWITPAYKPKETTKFARNHQLQQQMVKQTKRTKHIWRISNISRKRQTMHDQITIQNASELVGVSRHYIHKLIKANILRNTDANVKRGRSTLLISKKEVIDHFLYYNVIQKVENCFQFQIFKKSGLLIHSSKPTYKNKQMALEKSHLFLSRLRRLSKS